MALDQSALLDLLGELKLTDVTDRIRSATEKLYQELIDAEATAFIGAAPFERSGDRTTHRNGTRSRTLSTTAGDLDLKIPKLRAGSFFPALLERRRRVDQALFAVVMEAYVHGVSTRKVDDLVKALGADTGISKSEVSRICAGLDAEVAEFRDRTLAAQDFPYVFLDATYCKARVGHRIVSQAIVVAVGVAADGRREVLGFDVGDSENEGFWTAFLRSLKTRGLDGVKLVMSDAHTGLKKAISTVFQGAGWQRCRVHFMRNVLAVIPKGSQEMVASIIRTIFAQPDRQHIEKQFREVTTMLSRSHPKVAAMLIDAQPDLLAFAAFPRRHWRQIWSNNPLSVNRLPNDTSLSTFPMTRVPRPLGWKLLEIDGRRSSGYDRFSEEARGHVSHRWRLGRRRVGECLSWSPRFSGVQPEHDSLLRVRHR
jgi:putative transposase